MCEVRSRTLQLSRVAREKQSGAEKSGHLAGQEMSPNPVTMRPGYMDLKQSTDSAAACAVAPSC
jgi:hypothetical protein